MRYYAKAYQLLTSHFTLGCLSLLQVAWPKPPTRPAAYPTMPKIQPKTPCYGSFLRGLLSTASLTAMSVAGGWAVMSAGPAHADWALVNGQATCNFYPGDVPSPATNACAQDPANPSNGYFASPTIVDKILTPLYYDASCVGFVCTDELTFYTSGGPLPFNVDLDFNPDVDEAGSFIYKLDIVPGSGYVFDMAGLSGASGTATPGLTKTIATDWNGSDDLAGSILATLSSDGSFVKTTLPRGLRTIYVKDSWNPTNGTVDNIQNYYSQVPGPLPILGAGAALGISRRLRRRIKSAH